MPQYDINDVSDEVNILLDSDLDIIYDELNNPFMVINGLKTGKSPGEDLILNEFLRLGKHVLAEPLTRLFNHCFNIGYFPSLWTEGVIIPLHKKGDIHCITNYRGITWPTCLVP